MNAEPGAIGAFTSEWARVRVVFGAGSIERLGAEIDALGVSRVLMITTPGRSAAAGAARDALGQRLIGVCDRAAIHVPVTRVTEAIAAVERHAPDALLSVGGGSAVGLAKAVALERRLPIVAVPTTYAGSEMTGIWGMTDGDQKRTGRNAVVAPRLVVYDPRLTLSLPSAISAASGMNAVAHAVEAMYASNAGPVALGAAAEGLRALSHALPLVVQEPANLDARTTALRGAHAAGVALELASMGLHHKICHVLGGSFGLPHAETHAALLPHVAAFNAPAAPGAMVRIAEAIGAGDAVEGLFALDGALGLTTSLGDLGLRSGDVDRAVDLVLSGSYANPRSATRDELRALLSGAL